MNNRKAYTFEVRQTDQLGNGPSLSTTNNYTLDTTAPSNPSITSSPSSPANNLNPSWSFTGESGASFQCRLMRGGTTISNWASCSSPKPYSLTGQIDGTYTFEVRQSDQVGNGPSTPTSSNYTLDATAPSVPEVSSLTHPDESTVYESNNPGFNWVSSDNLSGVGGYSYVLDQASNTLPDPSSEGLSSSKSYSDLADGTWWFHVRAKDEVGNWSSAVHYKVMIDVPAPHVMPSLTGPSGQIDPDGNSVARNGDMLVFGGTIRKGLLGGPEPVAQITTCRLAVFDETGTQVGTLSVPLSSCYNSGGNLSGSYTASSFGIQRGSARLEVIAERGSDTSGIRFSALVMIDNDTPSLAAVSIRCVAEVLGVCDETRTLVADLSEAVKGDFSPVDFSVGGNLVVSASIDERQTCDWLANTDRYSDHNLLWGLMSR